jgi:hypothetical protein
VKEKAPARRGAHTTISRPRVIPLKTSVPAGEPKPTQSSWQLDFGTVCKDCPGIADSAQALVKAGVDPIELSRLFLFIAVAADSLANYNSAEARKRSKKWTDADRLLRRVPACLRVAADAAIEMARLLDDEEVAYQTKDVELMRTTADFVESRLLRKIPVKPHRLDRGLRLAQIRLLDYIRDATKKPHYEHVATLVSGAVAMAGLEKGPFDAGSLRDLKRKNPGLKSRLRSSWPRRSFLEKLAEKNPSLKSNLRSYPDL